MLFTDYSKPKIPQEYLGFDRVEQNYPILADDTCGTCICKKAERPGLYRLSSGAIPGALFSTHLEQGSSKPSCLISVS